MKKTSCSYTCDVRYTYNSPGCTPVLPLGPETRDEILHIDNVGTIEFLNGRFKRFEINYLSMNKFFEDEQESEEIKCKAAVLLRYFNQTYRLINDYSYYEFNVKQICDSFNEMSYKEFEEYFHRYITLSRLKHSL